VPKPVMCPERSTCHEWACPEPLDVIVFRSEPRCVVLDVVGVVHAPRAVIKGGRLIIAAARAVGGPSSLTARCAWL
jgi:hypothetical protein